MMQGKITQTKVKVGTILVITHGLKIRERDKAEDLDAQLMFWVLMGYRDNFLMIVISLHVWFPSTFNKNSNV